MDNHCWKYKNVGENLEEKSEFILGCRKPFADNNVRKTF